jgi:hypothetical protein
VAGTVVFLGVLGVAGELDEPLGPQEIIINANAVTKRRGKRITMFLRVYFMGIN